MKTTIIISLLSLVSIGGYAQSQYTTKDIPPLENNGKIVLVTPVFDKPFTVVSDPACYMYKRHGVVVLECPGVVFTPEKIVREQNYVHAIQPNGNIWIESESAYSGNYPAPRPDPDMPANAVPAKPSVPYVPSLDPPCYKYTDNHGREVMECHVLTFPPEYNGKK